MHLWVLGVILFLDFLQKTSFLLSILQRDQNRTPTSAGKCIPKIPSTFSYAMFSDRGPQWSSPRLYWGFWQSRFFLVTMLIVSMEFHHNLLIPALVVSIDFVRSIYLFSFIAGMLDLYIFLMSMVFYLLHGFDRLFVFWSISLWWYDTNRLFLKNNFRNTKLQAEAIVMHWANGSIPSFLDVICMKMFLNFRHLRLEISTSDQQYLVISFSKWKVSFLFSSYHDINFFRSSGFIPPGL